MEIKTREQLMKEFQESNNDGTLLHGWNKQFVSVESLLDFIDNGDWEDIGYSIREQMKINVKERK